MWWARLAAIILSWKIMCDGSFVAPDLGWCVAKVRVIERLLLAVSLDCRWIKRTMALEKASSAFCEKNGGVGRVGCFGNEFASDKGTSLGGSGECRLDGVHLVRCGLDPVVESGA